MNAIHIEAVAVATGQAGNKVVTIISAGQTRRAAPDKAVWGLTKTMTTPTLIYEREKRHPPIPTATPAAARGTAGPAAALRGLGMNAMTAVLRRAGRVAIEVVPAALVVRLGLPALGTLVLLAVLGVWAACWVFRSDARAERVSRVLLAWRGNTDCLTRDGAVSPPAPAARPRRRLLPRRS